jgi:hypothetical protein
VVYLLSFTVGNFRANFGIIWASKLQDPHFPVPFLTNQLVDLVIEVTETMLSQARILYFSACTNLLNMDYAFSSFRAMSSQKSLCLWVSISLSLSSHRGSLYEPAKIFPPSVRSQQVLLVFVPSRVRGGFIFIERLQGQLLGHSESTPAGAASIHWMPEHWFPSYHSGPE